jgi:Zn-finger in ubiquitin-hydrolases and other protein
MATMVCAHVEEIRDVQPPSDGCTECLQTGDHWVRLRWCLTCGHAGYRDTSKNKHAMKQFHKTHHPIIQSFNLSSLAKIGAGTKPIR